MAMQGTNVQTMHKDQPTMTVWLRKQLCIDDHTRHPNIRGWITHGLKSQEAVCCQRTIEQPWVATVAVQNDKASKSHRLLAYVLRACTECPSYLSYV